MLRMVEMFPDVFPTEKLHLTLHLLGLYLSPKLTTHVYLIGMLTGVHVRCPSQGRWHQYYFHRSHIDRSRSILTAALR